jgi:hypothetical protein
VPSVWAVRPVPCSALAQPHSPPRPGAGAQGSVAELDSLLATQLRGHAATRFLAQPVSKVLAQAVGEELEARPALSPGFGRILSGVVAAGGWAGEVAGRP